MCAGSGDDCYCDCLPPVKSMRDHCPNNYSSGARTELVHRVELHEGCYHLAAEDCLAAACALRASASTHSSRVRLQFANTMPRCGPKAGLSSRSLVVPGPSECCGNKRCTFLLAEGGVNPATRAAVES
jgi:hypothetical protein